MSNEHEPSWRAGEPAHVVHPASPAFHQPDGPPTGHPGPNFRLRVSQAPQLHRHLQRLLSSEQHGDWWDGASVYVTLPGDVTIASAGTSHVTAADEVQLRLNQGPALATLVSRRGLVVQDTATEARWAAWSAAMAGSGWCSVVTRWVGSTSAAAALCLYAFRPGAFAGEARGAVDALAGHARSAVSAALELVKPSEAEATDTGVSSALRNLMQQRGLDQYEAFEALCDLADVQRAPLTTTASTILAGRHGLA